MKVTNPKFLRNSAKPKVESKTGQSDRHGRRHWNRNGLYTGPGKDRRESQKGKPSYRGAAAWDRSKGKERKPPKGKLRKRPGWTDIRERETFSRKPPDSGVRKQLLGHSTAATRFQFLDSPSLFSPDRRSDLGFPPFRIH